MEERGSERMCSLCLSLVGSEAQASAITPCPQFTGQHQAGGSSGGEWLPFRLSARKYVSVLRWCFNRPISRKRRRLKPPFPFPLFLFLLSLPEERDNQVPPWAIRTLWGPRRGGFGHEKKKSNVFACPDPRHSQKGVG
ncbi:hypothetical protein LX32DRAFT_282297 [Colletotrichum zoysiae]|uniref:Uncharacterized protein n=1 Tax=Colletotrichum zoysiae TaxID=1216348 RepID=A0AAD9H1Z9_9PEZI|nr:hypothetical protein LX32DRAFT_282297 [Colletotrichum zoysiae]